MCVLHCLYARRSVVMVAHYYFFNFLLFCVVSSFKWLLLRNPAVSANVKLAALTLEISAAVCYMSFAFMSLYVYIFLLD